MANKNYKSDFILLQHIRLREGDEIRDIGFPEYDFRLYYYTTSRSSCYMASCIEGVCRNCMKTEDGKLLVLFKNHGLNCGDLKVDMEISLPNGLFADGIQREFIPSPTMTRLWDKPSEGYLPSEAELILPCIRGKDFRFEDFTPEQLDAIISRVVERSTGLLEEKINALAREKSAEYIDSLEEYTEEDLKETLKVTN